VEEPTKYGEKYLEMSTTKGMIGYCARRRESMIRRGGWAKLRMWRECWSVSLRMSAYINSARWSADVLI